VSGVVLVTGATGFAGSWLVRHLASPGTVVAWGRSLPPPDLAGLATWRQIDLLDRGAAREVIASLRPTAVYHLAGAAHQAESWRDTTTPLEGNALATAHLLDAIRRADLDCRVLVTGSAAVYAPSDDPIAEDGPRAPASPYALSKLAQEQVALRAFLDDGIPAIVARPFNHTGPGQSAAFAAPAFARQIALIEHGRLEPVLRVGNLEARRDLSDVRDVVRAYVALIAKGEPGTVYNVGAGTGRTIRAVLDALVSRSRVPVRIETDPERLRPSDVPSLVADTTRLRDATGWRPEIPFERTLDDLLQYWRETVAN
jgi:GDP-4-dehydro-6-deoxy-D-mannose reductase